MPSTSDPWPPMGGRQNRVGDDSSIDKFWVRWKIVYGK